FEGEADSRCASAGLKQRVNYFPIFEDDLKTLDEHSQRNEEGGQERELEVRRDTAKKCDKSRVRGSFSNPPVCSRILREEVEVFETNQLDEKIIGVEASLSVLNRQVMVFENNFSSLETVALEGIDEMKSNLEEVNKEGLTNLQLKLTEAFSSLHRQIKTLKRHVDETVGAELLMQQKGGTIGAKMLLPRWITIETRANQFPTEAAMREDRKKGVPHREGCYICGETTHAARYYPSLSKLSAMVAAQKQQEQATAQTRGPPREQADKCRATQITVRQCQVEWKDVRIMVDTGATHNFVTKKRAKDLCLNYVASDTMLKTVNTFPTTVHGFTP
ncbi:hypothetical protein H5410_052016, partial [Solanum commersonii]